MGEARQEGHLGQQSHKRGGLNEGGHLAEDKSGGLLCLHVYLRLGNEGGHQGKNQEAKRLGIPCGPVVKTLGFPC